MAKKFKKVEKDYILTELIERGADLFRRYGFKKTTITDITKEVGIAQGTFYHFFKSKELLYFTILEKEEEILKEKFFTVPHLLEECPKRWLKKTFKELLKEVENNPFIKELFSGDTMKVLLRKISADELEEHFLKDTSTLENWVESLHEIGLKLTVRPEVMGGLLRALFMMSLHREEIGKDVYDETINLQIELLVEALFVEEV